MSKTRTYKESIENNGLNYLTVIDLCIKIIIVYSILTKNGISPQSAILQGIIPFWNSFIIFNATVGPICFWGYLIGELVGIMLTAWGIIQGEFGISLLGILLIITGQLLNLMAIIQGIFLVI